MNLNICCKHIKHIEYIYIYLWCIFSFVLSSKAFKTNQKDICKKGILLAS